MKSHLAHFPLLLAAALALVPLGTARADESISHLAFSDPSKPGTLKVRVWHGDVTIRGADVSDIAVKSDSTAVLPTPRKDGMRVLSTSSSFVLSEKGNVATLEYGGEGWSSGSADFEITVPRSTSVVISNSAHGDLECSGITGDIDVRTMSGDVKLTDITGGAMVETMNGEINVDVRSVAPSRPLSFSSMHGQITIRVPDNTKANVVFRTHRGVILSNFDDKALVTKTEVFHRPSRASKKSASPDAPPAASPDAAPAPGNGSSAASVAQDKDSSDNQDWHNDVRNAVREAAEQAAMAAKEASEAVSEGLAEAHAEMVGAMPPLPPMTGGKVVTGTLNGGGTEIQAATLNGDILFKKAE